MSHFDLKECGDFLMAQAFMTAILAKKKLEPVQSIIAFLNEQYHIAYPDIDDVVMPLIMQRLNQPWCQFLIDTKNNLSRKELNICHRATEQQPALYVLNDYEFAKDLYFTDNTGVTTKFDISYHIHPWLLQKFESHPNRYTLLRDIKFLTGGHDPSEAFTKQMNSIFQFIMDLYPNEKTKLCTFKNENEDFLVSVLKKQNLKGCLEFLQNELNIDLEIEKIDFNIDLDEGIDRLARCFAKIWPLEKNILDINLEDLKDLLTGDVSKIIDSPTVFWI